MSESISFSVSTDTDVLDSIDRNAQKLGLSRSAYVLSWLPDTDTNQPEPSPTQGETDRRKRRGPKQRLAYAT